MAFLIPITSIGELILALFANAFPVLALILVIIAAIFCYRCDKKAKKEKEEADEKAMIEYAKAVPEESNKPGEPKPPFDEYVMDGWGTPNVVEKVRVFPDYIQYNTRCKEYWVHCLKFNYKVEGDKLFVKAFEFGCGGFDKKKKEGEKFYIVKDGNINQVEIDRYIDWCIDEGQLSVRKVNRTEEDEKRIKEWIDFYPLKWAKIYCEWHEFKYMSGGDRYGTRAKNWMMKKIKEKDWDLLETNEIQHK